MSHERIAGLRLGHFEPLVGGRIDIDFGAGPIPAEVLSACAIKSQGPREGGGFSVMLRAAVAKPCQGLFRVHHPGEGDFDLLLCPRRFDGDAVVYELLFN